MKIYLIKTTKWLGLGLLSLIVLLFIALALLQTGAARDRLARLISAKLSSDNLRVEIRGLEGFVPFHISADSLVLADRGGKFLQAWDFRLSWNPFSLIEDTWQIDEISCPFTELERLPETPAEKSGGKGFPLPHLPLSLPGITINRLDMARILLAEPVIGEAADFSLKGGMRSSGRNIRGDLTLKRVDRVGTLLDLDLSVAGQSPVLDLRFLLKEPEDGLLHLLLGIRGWGPLKAGLTGKGPLTRWPGRLSAELEKAGTLEAGILFAADERLGLTADGRLKFRENFLPASLSPLFKDNTSSFHLNCDLGPIQRPFPKDLEFTTSWVQAKLKSESYKNRPLTGRYSVYLPDLALFRALFKTDTSGTLRLNGEFSGPLDQPRTKLDLNLTNPRFGQYRAAALTLNMGLKALGKWSPSHPAMEARITGRLENLRRGTTENILPREPFRWESTAVIRKQDRAVWQIERFRLTAEDLRLAFTGQIDTSLAGLKGKMKLDIPDLATLPLPRFQAGGGRLHLEADLQGNQVTRVLSAAINGYTEGIKGLSPSLDQLLVPRTTYRGQVILKDRERLEVTGIDVQTGWAALSGGAEVNLHTKNISGAGNLRLPRLTPLQNLTGLSLKGALDLRGEFSGPLSDPVIRARARSGPLVVEGRSIEQVEMSVQARGLARPEGNFNVDLKMDKRKLISNGKFLLKNDRLDLTGLVLKGAGLSVQGTMKIGLHEPALTGELHGRDQDLAEISSLLGYPLAGRSVFSAKFRRGKTGQDLSVNIEGKDVSAKFGRAGSLSLKAELQNLFNHPALNISADIGNFSRKGLTSGGISFEAEGRAGAISFRTNASGGLSGQPLTLETEGEMERKDDHFRLRLKKFRGAFGQNTFGLRRPFLLRKTGREYELEKMDLAMGAGTITLSAHYTPREIMAEAGLKSLSPAFLSAFGLPECQGLIDGELSLSGRPEEPQARFSLLAKEIRPTKTPRPGLPPARIELYGNYSPGELRGSLRAAGLTDMKAEADLSIPLWIKLGPADFQFESQGNLKGKIAARMDLAQSAIFFPENQTLKGRLTADLSLGGSWGSPGIDGTVRVENGEYEHLEYGLLLRDIKLSARMTGSRIVIERVTATDGEDGRITAAGRLLLNRAENFPLNLDLQIKKGTLIRRQDLTVTLDGKLNLSGDVRDLLLAGRFTVGPANYELPRALPADIPVLDVTEINLPPGSEGVQKKEAPAGKVNLKLDMALSSPGQVFIRGRGLSSEWKGDIRISGSGRRPVVTGQLSIIRGRYSFYGKIFELTQGVIRFSGSTPPSPSFNIAAQNQQSNFTARILLSGTPSSLNVEFNSDPALPKDEILSRLLFGRSLADISPLQALRLASAVGSLAGAGGGGIMNFFENTRKLIGVDELSLSPGEAGQTTARIGKYLGQDIYVELEKGFGAEENGESVSVEVQITPNLSLESKAGVGGEGGAVFNWRWDY